MKWIHACIIDFIFLCISIGLELKVKDRRPIKARQICNLFCKFRVLDDIAVTIEEVNELDIDTD